LVIDAFFEFCTSSSLEFDCIAGLGRSGLPLASGLSLRYFNEGQSRPMIYVSDPLIGTQSKWDPPVKPSINKGDLTAGAKVLMLDTVMRTGFTVEDATTKLKGNKLQPKYFLVLADYEKVRGERRPAVESVQEQGVKVLRLFYFRPSNGQGEWNALVPATN